MVLDKKLIKQLIGVAFGAIAFNWVLQHLGDIGSSMSWLVSVVTPFLVGGAIAFVLHVPMKRIEAWLPMHKGKLKKARRPLAIVLTLLFVALLIAFALFVIIPGVSDTVQQIKAQIPAAAAAVQEWVKVVEERLPQVGEYLAAAQLDWQSLAQKAVSIVQNLGSGLVNSGVSLVSGVVSGVVTFFIAMVFAIYVLMQKEKLGRQGRAILYAVLPEQVADRTVSIVRLSDKTFSSFLSGQCIEAVILGCLFVVSMTLLRLPYAPLIGVLIAFTALIPIVGAFIGCIVGAVLILMVSPIQALEFVILFLVLQQVEGNLIYPHVVGTSVGLPSIWVLAAVTLGGKLMGVLGMLVFIPLCSVAYALLREFTFARLKKRGVAAEKWGGQVHGEEPGPEAPPQGGEEQEPVDR